MKTVLSRLSKTWLTFLGIVMLTVGTGLVALPKEIFFDHTVFGHRFNGTWHRPQLTFTILGKKINFDQDLRFGLDIQGGVQLSLSADMSGLPQAERVQALESAQEVIRRRVDLYGVTEPVVQSAKQGESYRILVELAGVKEASNALKLVGSTAKLDFRLENTATPSAAATRSAALYFAQQFKETGLTGKMLKRASTQFDPQTGQPVVELEFNEEGTRLFATLTQEHQGEVLGIFLDDMPISLPRMNAVITDGRGIISGEFDLASAKQLAIQLNAGALPVPVKVIEQRTIGASLGEEAVRASTLAGLIGLLGVVIFMIGNYGVRGILASVSLALYGIYSLALYKVLGVTVTLPGIAGLLLTVGMAVDANILVFERMKEEVRRGTSKTQAMERGFGRAWSSIKDANLMTIFVSLVLINPLDLPWLNTAGMVRGFGLMLLIGVLMSLFTSVVITRTLMRGFIT